MSNYQKPEVLSSADLSEGIYASSGTKADLTVTRGTDATSGQYRFTATVADTYVGKHVKITLTFDKALTGGWSSAAGTSNGTAFEIEHWQMPKSIDFTVTADSEPKYVSGVIATP